MKKLKWILPCMCMAVLAFPSCSDSDDDNGNDSPSTMLTPDEHKAKLESIGLNTIAKVNPADHERLMRTIDAFAEQADYGNLEIEENVTETVNSLLSSLSSICRTTNLGGMSAFVMPNSDLYSAARYQGIYTYDENLEKWTKTATEDKVLEFRFPSLGEQAVIRLAAIGKETKVYLYEEDGTKYEAMVPEIAQATLTLGSETLFSLSANLKMNGNRNADITCDFDASGYLFHVVTHVDQSKATVDFTLTVGGELLMSAKANVNGDKMLDEGNLDDIINGDGNAQDLFRDATGEVNINNEAIIKTSCSDVKALGDLLEQLDNQYDWRGQEQLEYNEKVSAAYNKYVKAELYYTDGDNVIASLNMQPYFEEDPYYEEGGYYGYEAAITFVSDDSAYSIESYFDDISFNDLINSAENLYDQYESYLKYLME